MFAGITQHWGRSNEYSSIHISIYFMFSLFIIMFTIVTCTIEFALCRSDLLGLILHILFISEYFNALIISLYHFSLYSLSCIMLFNCIQSLLNSHLHCCQNKTFVLKLIGVISSQVSLIVFCCFVCHYCLFCHRLLTRLLFSLKSLFSR